MAGNDANTIMLLHCDGADTSTTFTDSAVGGSHTVTPSGNAQVDTADKKFGTGALLLDGAGDYLTVTDNADLTLAGQFTIDFWIKTSTSTVDTHYRRAIDMPGPDFSVLFFDGSNPSTNMGVQLAGSMLITGNIAVADGNWNHIAVTRDGSNNIKLFVNGVQSGSTASNSSTWNPSSVVIGKYHAGSGHINGWMDEIRWSNIARWTTTFTPPTAEYSPVQTLVLTAAAGSYVLTGIAVALNPGKRMLADAGAYVLTGMSVLFHVTLRVFAAVGAYALLGQSAILGWGRKVTAAAGAYVLTGLSVVLRINRAYVIVAAAGAYVLTGLATILARAIRNTKYLFARRARPRLKDTRAQPPVLKE